MRILWIKTELLHPVDKGGRIRTYQMLKAMARTHDITYLSLYDGENAPQALDQSREYAQRVVTVDFSPPRRLSAGFAIALIRNMVSSLPYAIQRYQSSEMRAKILELAPKSDLLVCDFLAPSINVPDGLKVRSALFQHNVEAVIWQRHAQVASDPIRRGYFGEQWRRMERFEAGACRRFSHVVAVSETDAEIFRRRYGVQSVSHVSTGVDVSYFGGARIVPAATQEIVFIGSMDWMPNEDGVKWFVDEIFNGVRARIPDAKFTIVGRNPSPTVKRLASDGVPIEVTGTVDDVRPYLARAAICVVPLRVGGGTRLKIYEAMAAGAPVVSTTIGAEGLPLRDGEHLLIADTPIAQIEAVVSLLANRDRAAALAANAKKFVSEHCSWDAVAESFIAQCMARTS